MTLNGHSRKPQANENLRLIAYILVLNKSESSKLTSIGLNVDCLIVVKASLAAHLALGPEGTWYADVHRDE